MYCNFIYPEVRINPEYKYDEVLSGYNYNFSLLESICSGITSGSGVTAVQPGVNITTGGTISFPIINLADNIILTSVTAFNIYGQNIFSGSTNIENLFAGFNTIVTGITFSANQFSLNRNDSVSVLQFSGGSDVVLTNPSTNQIVLDINTLKYFISPTVPSGLTMNNGYRWLNTSNGNEYVYVDDGDSAQWIQPSSIPGPRGLPGFSDAYLTTGITSSAYTLTTDFNYYGVNYNGEVNLTMPNPTLNDGFNFTIKDESGNAEFNKIRLNCLVGLIDNKTFVDMNSNYMALHFVARNNNWWII